MKLVKAFAVLVIVLGVAGALAWHFWLKDQVAYAQTATAYGAKMVCSCRFVAEREMDSCLQDFTVDISMVNFDESDNKVRASVLGGLASSTAQFENGLGCTLVEAG